MSDFNDPVDSVRRVKIEEIEANDYNPNHVSNNKMRLLYQSIKDDGYTMPVVCFFDDKRRKYIIVDGFHRYLIMKTHKDIYDRNHGYLPISVINKPLQERMASTIRHNVARGEHDVELTAKMIKKWRELGCDNEFLTKKVGMSAEEILRLSLSNGLPELFAEQEFSKSWSVG